MGWVRGVGEGDGWVGRYGVSIYYYWVRGVGGGVCWVGRCVSCVGIV